MNVKADPTKLSTGVVDLFCGVGGLSVGFRREGFRIAAGIDVADAGRYAFERYTGGRFIHEDVANVSVATVKKLLGKARPSILIGCAPCQSFSEYNKKGRGTSWNMLPQFARIIEGAQPDIVSMENVARLATYRRGRTLNTFVARLARAGYDVSWYIVDCTDYGISQRRKRLVLFASRRGFVELVPATHRVARSLRKVIGSLPRLAAGSVDADDPYHRAQRLSGINSRRLRATRPGGSWEDWPAGLRARCHTTRCGQEFASVYGRLTYDDIGPTVTTQFFKVGSGRFGHPTQQRALSLREGALLQTFPAKFRFVRDHDAITFHEVGRLIGNAVPVRLGQIIARSIRRHIEQDY
jgi:DNA (cytosine-5)-methyltransferase 1